MRAKNEGAASYVAPDWPRVLADAVQKPGVIPTVYTAFWNYSADNQLLAWFQCLQRNLDPAGHTCGTRRVPIRTLYISWAFTLPVHGVISASKIGRPMKPGLPTKATWSVKPVSSAAISPAPM